MTTTRRLGTPSRRCAAASAGANALMALMATMAPARPGSLASAAIVDAAR